MIEIALLGFFGLLLVMGLRHPFIWVLAYLYVDILSPAKIGWMILPSIPFSLIAFAAVFGGWLLIDDKTGSRFGLRQWLIVLLLAYCAMTTFTAQFPEAAALKWAWVWKALIFAAFMPLTLTTRLRIEAATLVMVLSVGAIVIDGGMKTAFGGAGYGTLTFFVRENSGIYEGSIISAVAMSIIPLALWLARHGTIFPPDWRVRLFVAALIFACLLIPIGTEARTGLLCAGVIGALLMRSVKHRFAYAALAGVALLVAVPFLPASFAERMSTIGDHKGDQSASTRLAVWSWTLDYVKQHPLGGGFNAYIANEVSYDLVTTEQVGNAVVTENQRITEKSRAYHSSYFEMLGEQGYIGFGLWIWLQLLGLWQMERLRRHWIGRSEPDCQWQAPLATALQLGQVSYLVGSLFVGIAFQPFIFMLIGLQCALWSYLRREERLRQQGRPVPSFMQSRAARSPLP